MARWEQWPPSRPRRVEGGIKAQSKRGAIGEQWWSRRFIDVLESYGMSGRLARGRSYARAGQVLNFELSQGRVTAQVQGSLVRPYQVRIGVLPLTTPQWRRVQDKLASQALFRAKLLAGEMPHEIEEVFADCGTPLFPRSAADLEMRCSCPDWGVPCKHVAAVCYVLAEEFDRDPFAMLAWRGRNRDTLLAALRLNSPRRATGSPEPDGRGLASPGGSGLAGPGRREVVGPGGGGLTGAGGPGLTGAGGSAAAMTTAMTATADVSATRAVLADVTGPPLAHAGDFWSPGLSQARLRALAAPPVATAVPDLLLRMFDPPPVMVRGKDLRTVLAAAYEQMSRPADSESS